MDGQDKTNQIIDWELVLKRDEISVKVRFHSGKTFEKPLHLCQITPKKELKANLLLRENGIYEMVEKVTEYGNKYIACSSLTDSKKIVAESAKVKLFVQSDLKKERIFSYFNDVIEARIELGKAKDRPMLESLKRQMDQITPCKETALHAYCYGENKSREGLKHYIFPFGLNESQMRAVENAFSSQISIIEGPPGTGKTQTILNIIANILITKKSVAIVSNNNFAVENVYEKMAKYDLDYLIAKLGSKDNRINFFKNLPSKPQEEDSLTKIDVNEIDLILEKLKDRLVIQNKVAKLKSEISELRIEKEYLNKWHKENPLMNFIDIKNYRMSLSKISDLLVYINSLEKRRISLKERVRFLIEFKMFKVGFLNDYSNRLNFYYSLQTYYYERRIVLKEQELKKYNQFLENSNHQQLQEELIKKSLSFLKQELQRSNNPTHTFTFASYKKEFKKFIERFLVIGSSTHSIINSIAPGAILDYVIIDEASQQDIIPGILGLGCARNIVIVGDRKQLSHIPMNTKVESPSVYFDCNKNSLLDSFVQLFSHKVPITLLKEHYRCHPKIIQFCNQQFYDNQLIPMTSDKGEPALELIITSKGNHTRNRSNLREIESFLEVGPLDNKDVGFIAPFNNQIQLANQYLSEDFLKATIHKFQGRECKEIIFSTVLDKKRDSQNIIDFVDSSNLVNVAVSRAIKKFTLITGDEVFTSNNKSLAALIRYIRYYASNKNIHESPVVSAFDLLYDEYDQSLEKLRERLNVSDPQAKSAGVFSLVLRDILRTNEFDSLKYHMQIGLIQLVSLRKHLFTDRELEFMKQKASCDFVIYYKVGKKPIGVIEIDGGYHEIEKQKERDLLKNSILDKAKIPLLRIKTIEGRIEEKTKSFLRKCVIESI